MAEDVTLFVDDSVTCAGPPMDGPSLYEWAQTVDDETLRALASPELYEEIRGLSAMSFPTRRVQSVYLDWFHRQVVDALPPHVEVITHASAVVDLFDGDDGRQWVVLDVPTRSPSSSTSSCSRSVISTRFPTTRGRALAQFAGEHQLAYVPCGHTADQDLSVLAPGEDVLVLGLGQAFTDLLVLVTEGRGGRFVDRPDGTLVYEPSGLEPVLHVGSRRGVPYRSKLTYRLQAPLAPLPRFLDDDAIAALLASDTPLDFFVDVLPLVAKEIGWAYYHELFAAHPERTTTSWDEFSTRVRDHGLGRPRAAPRQRPCPTPPTTSTSRALDQPLADLRFGSSDALHSHVVEHVAADVARRTDPRHSPDLAAFTAMLGIAEPLRRIAARVGSRSRLEGITTWWLSFFMYYTSGPPPERLRQLLALVDAGLVRFVGADMRIAADEAARHLRRDELEPSRRDPRHRARRRAHRAAVGEPGDERLAAPSPRAGRDRRGRGDRRRLVGEHRSGVGDRSRVAAPPRRRHWSPSASRDRRVHQPPGGRRVCPPTVQRARLPPERRRGPRRARDAGRSSRRARGLRRVTDVLRNAVWHSLLGPQSDHAEGTWARPPVSSRRVGLLRDRRTDCRRVGRPRRARAGRGRGAVPRGAAAAGARRMEAGVPGRGLPDGAGRSRRRSCHRCPRPTRDRPAGVAARARRRRRRRHGRSRRPNRAGAVSASHHRARRIPGHLPRRHARRDGGPPLPPARLRRGQRGVHRSRVPAAAATERSSPRWSPIRSRRRATRRCCTSPQTNDSARSVYEQLGFTISRSCEFAAFRVPRPPR